MKFNKKVVVHEVSVQEQLVEIKRKVNSIQWCVTIYSITILIMLNILSRG